MLRRQELRLVTLGRLALIGAEGDADPSLASRRRKLAVLAILALAKRPLSRDQLAEMFWGGQPDERARHSLSSTLSHLRKALGRDAISARAAEVELTADDRLEVDALQFVQAVEDRKDAQALELYAGPFLDGVHVDGSHTFDQWVAGERARLEGIFVGACQRRCAVQLRAQRWDECADLARRWFDAAPVSADAALHRLRALRGPGTRDANHRALEEFERIRERLHRDYQLRPDKAVAALAREIAAEVDAAGSATAEMPIVVPTPPIVVRTPPIVVATPPIVAATPPIVAASGAPELSASTPAPRPLERVSRRLVPISLVAAAALAVIGVAAIAGLPGASERANLAASDAAPMIAIVDIAYVGGDTASAWIADGLPRMMANTLARSRDVDVISTDQVRQVRARAELPRGAVVTPERAHDLARAVGAALAVTGTVIDADTALQLDLTIRDVRTGSLVRSTSVRAANVLALADAAAERVLIAAGAPASGTILSAIETPSVEAYAYYVRFLDLRDTRGHVWWLLDSAIALDSGFVAAVHARMEYAEATGDEPTRARLESAFLRAAHRATDWDRLTIAATSAFRSGDWARTEATARALAERFPRDPRAYAPLIRAYQNQGRWKDVERIALTQVGLDSLGAAVGLGPCGPCLGYVTLATARMSGLGDYRAAEQDLTRLTRLQPDFAQAWYELSKAQSAQGRFDAALESARRAIAVSPDPSYLRLRVAHLFLTARRYDEADSVLRAMPADTALRLRALRGWALAMVDLERGRLRAAQAALDSLPPGGDGTRDRVWADVLAQRGMHAEARRGYEGIVRRDADSILNGPDSPRRAQRASQFARHRASIAEAVAPTGDVAALAILADSMERFGAYSYHGRDRILHRYARGFIALHERRWAEAERDFGEIAGWSAWGWPSARLYQATAQMERGRPDDALATLRPLYDVPPDHFNRYIPRWEIDLLMADAFRRTGQPDSALVYVEHVRRAWRGADARLTAKLAPLGGDVGR